MKQQQNNNNTATPVTLYLHDEQTYITVKPVRMYKIKRFSLHDRNVMKYVTTNPLQKMYISCTAVETEEEIYYTFETVAHAVEEFFGLTEGQKVYITV